MEKRLGFVACCRTRVAQNEMKAKGGLPQGVRLNTGLGIRLRRLIGNLNHGQ